LVPPIIAERQAFKCGRDVQCQYLGLHSAVQTRETRNDSCPTRAARETRRVAESLREAPSQNRQTVACRSGTTQRTSSLRCLLRLRHTALPTCGKAAGQTARLRCRTRWRWKTRKASRNRALSQQPFKSACAYASRRAGRRRGQIDTTGSNRASNAVLL
jgi:hypothetical protein